MLLWIVGPALVLGIAGYIYRDVGPLRVDRQRLRAGRPRDDRAADQRPRRRSAGSRQPAGQGRRRAVPHRFAAARNRHDTHAGADGNGAQPARCRPRGLSLGAGRPDFGRRGAARQRAPVRAHEGNARQGPGRAEGRRRRREQSRQRARQARLRRRRAEQGRRRARRSAENERTRTWPATSSRRRSTSRPSSTSTTRPCARRSTA